LTISPLLLSNFIATGNPFYLPTITINIWTGVYGQSDPLANYPPLTPIPNTAFQIFLKNPSVYIRHWAGQLIEFAKLDLIGAPLKYLFPFGVYLIVLREKNKELVWLLFFSLFFILSLANAYINPRYALFSIPFIIATCCYSAYFIIRALINKLPRHYAINILAILLLVYGFFIVERVFLTAKNELYDNPLSHAIKLVSNNLNKDGLRDNKEVVCFNGEFYNLDSPILERFYLPDEILYMDKKNGVTELDNYLKAGGYRYIIYEETVGVKRFPNLKVLLEPERLPKEYHLLLLIDLPKVAVYRYGQ